MAVEGRDRAAAAAANRRPRPVSGCCGPGRQQKPRRIRRHPERPLLFRKADRIAGRPGGSCHPPTSRWVNDRRLIEQRKEFLFFCLKSQPTPELKAESMANRKASDRRRSVWLPDDLRRNCDLVRRRWRFWRHFRLWRRFRPTPRCSPATSSVWQRRAPLQHSICAHCPGPNQFNSIN